MEQQTQSETPDPGEEFLYSLLSDMKSRTAKQKRTCTIGALNVMDELLEDTESDQYSSAGLSETSASYHRTALQEAQDSPQSVLTYWETE
jgi:cell division protein ZapA (FtsZ GTPase activity inhibitor)